MLFCLQPSNWLRNLPHSVNQTYFWKVSWMFSTILNQISPNLFLLYDETCPSSNIVFWQGGLSFKFASSDDCWKWTRSWVLSSVAAKKQQAGQLEDFFGAWRHRAMSVSFSDIFFERSWTVPETKIRAQKYSFWWWQFSSQITGFTWLENHRNDSA